MAPPPAARHFQSLLADRFGTRLQEARLFESFARGDATEDSDVDVLVLVEQLTREDKRLGCTFVRRGCDSMFGDEP